MTTTTSVTPWSAVMELVRWRELMFALARRELVLRYKRSVVGIGWALAEPLLMLVVYALFFGRVLHANRGIENYALYLLSGMALWQFLSTSLGQSGSALMDHASLLRKSYFPRESLVFAVIVSRFSTLALTLCVCGALACVPSLTPRELAVGRIGYLVLAMVLTTMLATGASLLVAVLNVMLRDTAFAVHFALRLGFYACPVVYPASAVPEQWKALYDLNPMVALLSWAQAFTDSGVVLPSSTSAASALIVSLGMFFAGWWGFRRLAPPVMDLL